MSERVSGPRRVASRASSSSLTSLGATSFVSEMDHQRSSANQANNGSGQNPSPSSQDATIKSQQPRGTLAPPPSPTLALPASSPRIRQPAQMPQSLQPSQTSQCIQPPQRPQPSQVRQTPPPEPQQLQIQRAWQFYCAPPPPTQEDLDDEDLWTFWYPYYVPLDRRHHDIAFMWWLRTHAMRFLQNRRLRYGFTLAWYEYAQSETCWSDYIGHMLLPRPG